MNKDDKSPITGPLEIVGGAMNVCPSYRMIMFPAASHEKALGSTSWLKNITQSTDIEGLHETTNVSDNIRACAMRIFFIATTIKP